MCSKKAPCAAAAGRGASVQHVRERRDGLRVRDAMADLFYVSPNTGADHSAAVRLCTAVAGPGKAGSHCRPSLSVPLENVTWRSCIPPANKLEDYGAIAAARGTLRPPPFGLGAVPVLVVSKRSADAQQAVALLQEPAPGCKRRAAKGGRSVSPPPTPARSTSSNEDARVQLRKPEDAASRAGPHTDDNACTWTTADATRNEQLEQAAT